MTGWILVTVGVLGLIASAFLGTPLLLLCFALVVVIGLQEMHFETEPHKD